jgi:A/G-specific adenine glycosylase
MDDNLALPATRLKPREIAPLVLAWWDVHRRVLPWRGKAGERRDPYRVWLAEILLQQTSATAATPYFLKFVARWPTVEALAAASLDEVIAAFAGLGYYSRARNLHACAQIVARRDGRFPLGEAELRALPGVGAYTAPAVAAIAYGAKTAPVDGNVARILARLCALEAPIARARRRIGEAAAALTPTQRPGDFAEALMDLGALICRPRRPDCPACPLLGVCAAAATGAPEAYPRRAAAKRKPARVGAAFFAWRADGAILARRRPLEGLLGGTLELPGGPWQAAEGADASAAQPPFPAPWRRLPGEVEQAFTHFTLRLTLYAAEVGSSPPGAQGLIWIEPAAAEGAGFSSLMLKAVAHARRHFHARFAG